MRKLTAFLLVLTLMFGAVSVLAQDVETITFWSDQFQPERVERQRAIIAAFEEANPGVRVELAVMDNNLMDQLMTINVAAGTPPDVVLTPMVTVNKWYSDGLLDADFATSVIDSLGVDTFFPGALALIQLEDGRYPAIPVDGWGQLLVYREDLFAEAGLTAPDSYANILAAAEALHDPDNGLVGFCGPNNAGEVYTWQTFEHLALANGAAFVDADGNITFDTPEMIEAIQWYSDLMTSYGPGESDWFWQQTRANYLGGGCAMTIWSPFILDEMAGLRDSAFPSCEECADDPAFIARNSGFVSGISGFSSDAPAAWGETNNLGVAPGASESAQAFIEFYMNESYVDGLAVAPEGKFPMRPGTADEPSLYIDAWRELEVGVDRKAPLSDFYGAEELDLIVAGAEGYSRMGYDVGQSLLASAVNTQFFIQENLVAVLNGDLSAEDAAIEMQIAAEDLQAELTEE